jgi:Domain of unknown function (DUF4276)
MDRCRLLVEGQTEETFANRTLVPHLFSLGFHDVSVTVVETKRTARGKFSGGLSNWAKPQSDIRSLVKDSGALVTTLIDFYGLPFDVPGVSTLQAGWNARQRVKHVEDAMSDAIGNQNFLPHLVLHEIEALLYADPAAVEAHFNDPAVRRLMLADLAECFEPELVNDGPNTAPSKRIIKHRPGYVKSSDGPAILADIGLPSIRRACPHFHEWLLRVEAEAPPMTHSA